MKYTNQLNKTAGCKNKIPVVAASKLVKKKKKALIKNAELWDSIDKVAALNVSELEAYMYGNVPYHLSDREENAARKSFGKSAKKSIAIRHPVLTGIPTLGIWPGIAKARAYSRASTAVADHYPEAGRKARRSKMINASHRREKMMERLLKEHPNGAR